MSHSSLGRGYYSSAFFLLLRISNKEYPFFHFFSAQQRDFLIFSSLFFKIYFKKEKGSERLE
jgi:hypothetical protein